ncbi:hypothetical protein DFH06DRAFT_1465883 [Mycena polygramma]|nr:hypothetical protein DFH06DRAFT_1465883 [Mycena polygramma]
MATAPASLPSVLTLPNEITSDIFLHFLPNSYLSIPNAPHLLTHICRQWRETALTSPALRRAIPFVTYTEIPLERRLEIFNLWLSRSRFCSLSIDIVEAELQASPGEIVAVVTAAALHCERWEHLKLHLSISRNLPTIVEGRLPLLRHIDLGLADYASFANMTAFRDLPSLGAVALDLRRDDAASLKLPWAQVTSLSFKNGLRDEYVLFLQRTPNLVQCTLTRRNLLSANTLVPHVTLPSLESLTLVVLYADYDDHEGYLGRFIVPALSSLQISKLCLAANHIDALTSFISKSGCQLNDVCITGHKSVSEDSYRSAFPSIAQFTFEVLGIS